MKYIEELKPGDCCSIEQVTWIVTCDYKRDGSKLLINLSNGQPRWMDANAVCSIVQIFRLDTENNTFIPFKTYEYNENHIY